MTGGSGPPRRAVLFADQAAGYRRLVRSPGWPGEAAAVEATRLLDSGAASTQLAQVGGFLRAADGGWIIIGGGLVTRPGGGVACWRDAVVLGAGALTRIRGNPFHILARAAPVVPADETDLAPPVLPSARDDAEQRRLEELHHDTRAHRPPGELEPVLAAVFDADHVLVLRSTLSLEDLELLILLLPPSLRGRLTFHAHALSAPLGPLPRLVLTPLAERLQLERAAGEWGHCLPETRHEISPPARELARDLIALLDAPGRLAAAHAAYETYVGASAPPPASLLEEVETLLRFARLEALQEGGEAGAALRVLAQSLIAHRDPEHPETGWLLAHVCRIFAPELLGAAVVESLRHGQTDATVPALVMEHFLAEREASPEALAAFTGPIAAHAGSLTLAGSADARRTATMLMLLATARGDAGAFASALCVPPDAPTIARLGGADAWASADHPRLAAALRALADAEPPRGVQDALHALAALAGDLPHSRLQVRLLEAGVLCLRASYRRTPAQQWTEVLSLADPGLALCRAVTAAGGVGLDGRAHAEQQQEAHGTGAVRPNPIDYADHSDPELFFGFLGADGSRSRITRPGGRDMVEPLVQELDARIRRDATVTAAANEAAHWSIALLERIRRGEIETVHTRAATRLLQRTAPSVSATVLRAYVAGQPEAAAALLEHGDAAELLAQADSAAFASAAVETALREATRTCDLAGVLAVGAHLRAAGATVGGEDQGVGLASRVRALVLELRLNTPRATMTRDLVELDRALTPILDASAAPHVRAAIQAYAAEDGAAAGGTEPPPLVAGLASMTGGTGAGPARRRHVLIAAGAILAVAAGVTIVLLQRGDDLAAAGATGASLAAPPQSGRPIVVPAPGASVPAAGAATADPTGRLTVARERAAEQDWAQVVALLTQDTTARPRAQAFAWDSLLAHAAFAQAQRLGAGDVRRRPLLETAWASASQALVDRPPFAPGNDELRLLRAETCISGGLECDETEVSQDLIFAARSASRRVSARAAEVLAIWQR